MRQVSQVDLAAAAPTQTAHADVCIVGAGAAGIYLAVQLARRGRSVVLVEAGPATGVEARTIGFDPVFTAADYPGATVGRYFGMGGSTTRWGGALIPHTRRDLRDDSNASAWGRIVDTVGKYTPAVLREVGFWESPDFDEYAAQQLGPVAARLMQAGFDVQASLLLPYKRRNLNGLLSAISETVISPRIFLNAVAKSWSLRAEADGAARVVELEAVSPNRHTLTVSAGHFVLGAGAIESARILLEIDQSMRVPVLPADSAAGCYLADHLSISVADVDAGSLEKAAALFAPRFMGSWMRGIRLLERDAGLDLPRAFAHFIFDTETAGFAVAKELLGAVQRRGLPAISAKDVAVGMGDLMGLAFHKYARSRLYIPRDTPMCMQLDMEQHAVRENRISLSRERDEYGRQKASIHWQISDQDLDSLAKIAGRLLTKWPGRPGGLPDLIPLKLNNEKRKPHDAYHPVGTCRMGVSAEAVVDFDLRVKGTDNLWIVSTGVLPCAGSANPTFTMLCLAHSLANRLN